LHFNDASKANTKFGHSIGQCWSEVRSQNAELVEVWQEKQNANRHDNNDLQSHAPNIWTIKIAFKGRFGHQDIEN
jgi:hypothetical protein